MRKDRADLKTKIELFEEYLSEKIKRFEEQNNIKIKNIFANYGENLNGQTVFQNVKLEMEI